MFANIYDEEKVFPYLNISLEEARRLRYLVRNFYAFRNGELVQMSIENIDGIIKANGMVYEKGNNKTFDSEVEYGEDKVTFYSEIEEVYGKRFYSIDEFCFLEKDIKVSSKLEGKDEVVRKIPYDEENRILK